MKGGKKMMIAACAILSAVLIGAVVIGAQIMALNDKKIKETLIENSKTNYGKEFMITELDCNFDHRGFSVFKSCHITMIQADEPYYPYYFNQTCKPFGGSALVLPERDYIKMQNEIKWSNYYREVLRQIADIPVLVSVQFTQDHFLKGIEEGVLPYSGNVYLLIVLENKDDAKGLTDELARELAEHTVLNDPKDVLYIDFAVVVNLWEVHNRDEAYQILHQYELSDDENADLPQRVRKHSYTFFGYDETDRLAQE